ncbi:hypothetical protein ACE1B6_14915 [Aerosakkonemataceae cyanobacterium BLCC-F154]|uniref:TonB C-terminal domain-containing protein n=1 Tax=Floridaenema fluviatile BLCC-F154 TaxID=3153640 RepID=A0ABV4YEE0_9CYAN
MSDISRMSTLSETMNLPLVVAALTSVGLHSLFWFYQPVVPMADKPTVAASDRRSVKVVQLTPEEILRLPEYAQQRTQPTLPLPPGQIPTNLLPSLPEAKSEITLPPPPSFPIYNSNPSPTTPSATPSATPETKTPSSRRRSQTTVPKSPQETPKNNRRNTETSRKQKPETNRNINNDDLKPETSSVQETRNTQLPPPIETQKNPPTSSGEFMSVYQQFLARLDSSDSPTDIPNNPTPLSDLPPVKPRVLPNSDTNTYAYNKRDTTVAEGQTNYLNWWKTQKESYGESLLPGMEKVPDTIRSPLKEKLPNVGIAGIAVLVDISKGKIVGEPKLTRSTGYQKFDDLAIENVKKRDFPTNSEVKRYKYKVYHYEIEINQDNLPPA